MWTCHFAAVAAWTSPVWHCKEDSVLFWVHLTKRKLVLKMETFKTAANLPGDYYYLDYYAQKIENPRAPSEILQTSIYMMNVKISDNNIRNITKTYICNFASKQSIRLLEQCLLFLFLQDETKVEMSEHNPKQHAWRNHQIPTVSYGSERLRILGMLHSLFLYHEDRGPTCFKCSPTPANLAGRNGSSIFYLLRF